MLGIDMLVKFGYCLICDNGPGGTQHNNWMEALLKSDDVVSSVQHCLVTHCTSCGEEIPPNKNLLNVEVKVTGLH